MDKLSSMTSIATSLALKSNFEKKKTKNQKQSKMFELTLLLLYISVNILNAK